MRSGMKRYNHVHANLQGTVDLLVGHTFSVASGITQGRIGVARHLTIQSRSWQVTAPTEGIA